MEWEEVYKRKEEIEKIFNDDFKIIFTLEKLKDF
jgi:hypothetical protein